MLPPAQPNVRTMGEPAWSARFWLLVISTGLSAGLGGGLLMRLLHSIEHVTWSFSEGTLLEGIRASSPGRRVFVLLASGLVAGVGMSILRSRMPGEGGEVAETIWLRSGKFHAPATVGRALISIVIVGMGASLGREGALKQIGATIASRLSAWARLDDGATRALAAFGAGAGMAAAYNVPCGGALFALEILLGELSLFLAIPALAASGIATAVSWCFLSNRPAYELPEYVLSIPQIGWAVVAGPLLGLASVGFVRAIAWSRIPNLRGRSGIVAPALVFTAWGFIAILFPELLGNGQDVVQLAFLGQVSLGLLFTLPALKLLATASSLASGAPGGLFTPTLTYGCLLGGLLGFGFKTICPDAPLGSYAVIGAGAVLAAANQAPISSAVLLLELTGKIDPLMVPLLIAITGATLVARRLEPLTIESARIDIHRDASPPKREAGGPSD